MGGISIWQLIIVAVIVVLLFGTKKLRNMGGDLGSAVKGFKKAMSDEDQSKDSLAEKKSDSLSDNSTTASSSNDSSVKSKEKDQA